MDSSAGHGRDWRDGVRDGAPYGAAAFVLAVLFSSKNMPIAVVEALGATSGKFLLRLMATPGDEDDVAGPRQVDRPLDRPPAVELHRVGDVDAAAPVKMALTAWLAAAGFEAARGLG